MSSERRKQDTKPKVLLNTEEVISTLGAVKDFQDLVKALGEGAGVMKEVAKSLPEPVKNGALVYAGAAFGATVGAPAAVVLGAVSIWCKIKQRKREEAQQAQQEATLEEILNRLCQMGDQNWIAYHDAQEGHREIVQKLEKVLNQLPEGQAATLAATIPEDYLEKLSLLPCIARTAKKTLKVANQTREDLNVLALEVNVLKGDIADIKEQLNAAEKDKEEFRQANQDLRKHREYLEGQLTELEAKLARAEHDLNEALAREAERTTGYQKVALQLESENETEKAARTYDEALEQANEQPTRVRLYRGAFRLRQGDWKGAEEDLVWCLNHAPGGLREDAMELGMSWTESIYRWGRYLEGIPTALLLLHRTLEWIGEKDGRVGGLHNQLGLLYQSAGQFETAESHFNTALVMGLTSFGELHRNTITCKSNLASLYLATGQAHRGGPLLKAALAHRKEVLGDRHPDTINSMNNLATYYMHTGRYSKAGPLLRKALALSQEVLGAKHTDTIMMMNTLAGLYLETGQYSRAEPLFLASLAMREEILGPRHPHTISVMNNLAQLYEAVDRSSEAVSLMTDVLSLSREVLGERHPHTIAGMNNLAMLYKSIGQVGKAEHFLLEALTLCREVHGERHPHTIGTLNNLALLYRVIGRHGEAEPLLVEALALRRETQGNQHPNTIQSMNNLATLWIIRGNPEGRKLHNEAYRLSRALPKKHQVRLAVESWVDDPKADCRV